MDQPESPVIPVVPAERTLPLVGDGSAATRTQRGAISLLAQFTISVTGFLTGVMVARGCSAAELDAYAGAMTILLVLSGVQAELIASPCTVLRHRESESSERQYIGSSFVFVGLSLFCGGLLFTVICVAAGWFQADIRLDLLIRVAWIVAPCLLLRDFLRAFSFARFQVAHGLLIDVTVAVVQLGGLAALFFSSRLELPRAYLVLAAAALIASFLWFRITRPRFEVDRGRISADWRRNWQFSRWSLASQLIGSCTPYMVMWLVAALCVGGSAGRYQVCTQMISPLQRFAVAVAQVLTPEAAAAYAQGGVLGLRLVLRKTLLLFAGVLGSLTVGVVLLAEPAVLFFYGSKFAGVGAVCAVMAVQILFNSVSIVAGNGMWALNRPQSNLPGDIATCCLSLGAAVILVPQWNLLGAAIAGLFGAAGGAAVRWVILRRRLAELQP